jgi:hypothetical protein
MDYKKKKLDYFKLFKKIEVWINGKFKRSNRKA